MEGAIEIEFIQTDIFNQKKGKAMKKFTYLFTIFIVLLYQSLYAQWIRNSGPSGIVYSLALSTNEAGDTSLFAGTQSSGVFLSTNKGISLRAIIVSPNEAGNINMFAGTAGGGVFLSTNKGKSWTTVNSGLTNTTINALIISDPYLFAATGDGIWRRLLSETTTTASVQINTDNRNGVFGLEQNYPNPFNSSTKISYQVPTTENVTLKVYDILGNEVSTLVNEKKLAGIYEVEFNGQGLTAGTYFYNLRAGTSAEIKKMILKKGKENP